MHSSGRGEKTTPKEKGIVGSRTEKESNPLRRQTEGEIVSQKTGEKRGVVQNVNRNETGGRKTGLGP